MFEPLDFFEDLIDFDWPCEDSHPLDSIPVDSEDPSTSVSFVDSESVPADLIGSPEMDAVYWEEQEQSASCAVVAQIGIYESITGVEIPEQAACDIAQQNGWFDPEIGTLPDQVGALLESFGIPVERCFDASIEDIAQALEQGEKVIVGLDAQEIWSPQWDYSGQPLEQSDMGHAVWVTGIDVGNDGSVELLLNDSGHPNGQMVKVPIADFMNAWQDYGNFMMYTQRNPIVA